LITHLSKSSGWVSRKELSTATAALLTTPCMAGRGERAAWVAAQSVRSSCTVVIEGHSSCTQIKKIDLNYKNLNRITIIGPIFSEQHRDLNADFGSFQTELFYGV
jgi:hypothetical protein